MNVYDFDKTIYPKDSTIEFWKWCVIKYPLCLINFVPSLISFIKYIFKKNTKEEFKETFYGFLRYIPDIDKEIYLFWDKNIEKVQKWYIDQKNEKDLIISASPLFLIDEACVRLGIKCIASKVDKKSGKLLGPNCKGIEKVKRFNELYPKEEIDLFYSDSMSDKYLAKLAKKAYLVKGNRIVEWNFDSY